MFLSNIIRCSAISSSSIEESLSKQHEQGISPNLCPLSTSTNRQANISRTFSGFTLSADSGNDITDPEEGGSDNMILASRPTNALSGSRLQRTTQPNLEDKKHLGSRAFKPQLYKAVQPSNLAEDQIVCSQTDLSQDQIQSSRSQASTISQASGDKHESLPLFKIQVDTESCLSRLASITPQSLSKLKTLREEAPRNSQNSNRPIDTNVDLLHLLEKNDHLVFFHHEKIAVSPSNSQKKPLPYDCEPRASNKRKSPS